ncbi:hypothetical protein OJAV_G00170380 [Oryzias javanicus]|uniref:Uncharacterized protein n=1 Tax=Oryzias javanicus TaxID=123683 RepID=A0A3S2NX47_ORYJA|nr:hypothetical protein OJAV_G00170380 [Oryzias javanicus]
MRSRRMSAGSSSAEFPQVCEEKEVLVDLQRCSSGRESALDQEEPEPPQIKEEEEELCTTQEDERLDREQENRVCLHPHFKPKPGETFGVSESDVVQSEEEMEELRPPEITWKPANRRKANLPLPADAEVLADCQLSRIQEERTPSIIKSDHADVDMSEESRQLHLKVEADTFSITLSYEDGDSEPESENRDHQESKPSTAEPNPRKRRNRTEVTPYLLEAGHINRASKKPLLTESEKGPGIIVISVQSSPANTT